jgi:hypothetical protein
LPTIDEQEENALIVKPGRSARGSQVAAAFGVMRTCVKHFLVANDLGRVKTR